MPCTWLLADNTGIDASLEERWPPRRPPAQWMDEFTMHGRFPLRREQKNLTGKLYLNHTFEKLVDHKAAQGTFKRKDKEVTLRWDKKSINELVNKARKKEGAVYRQTGICNQRWT